MLLSPADEKVNIIKLSELGNGKTWWIIYISFENNLQVLLDSYGFYMGKLEFYISIHWYYNSLEENLMGNYNRNIPNMTINRIYSLEPISV